MVGSSAIAAPMTTASACTCVWTVNAFVRNCAAVSAMLPASWSAPLPTTGTSPTSPTARAVRLNASAASNRLRCSSASDQICHPGTAPSTTNARVYTAAATSDRRSVRPLGVSASSETTGALPSLSRAPTVSPAYAPGKPLKDFRKEVDTEGRARNRRAWATTTKPTMPSGREDRDLVDGRPS